MIYSERIGVEGDSKKTTDLPQRKSLNEMLKRDDFDPLLFEIDNLPSREKERGEIVKGVSYETVDFMSQDQSLSIKVMNIISSYCTNNTNLGIYLKIVILKNCLEPMIQKLLDRKYTKSEIIEIIERSIRVTKIDVPTIEELIDQSIGKNSKYN